MGRILSAEGEFAMALNIRNSRRREPQFSKPELLNLYCARVPRSNLWSRADLRVVRANRGLTFSAAVALIGLQVER
jgi:hypothetical protein